MCFVVPSRFFFYLFHETFTLIDWVSQLSEAISVLFCTDEAFETICEAWVFIIVFLQIWKTVGMNVLMYYASLMSIDSSFYEAAAIEGATRWQMIRRITLPMLYPMMIILTILAIGKIMNSDFGLFYQVPMDSKTLYATTDVLETYVYRALIQSGNIGMSSAAGFIKSVVGFLLVLGTNRLVKKINPDYALY